MVSTNSSEPIPVNKKVGNGHINNNSSNVSNNRTNKSDSVVVNFSVPETTDLSVDLNSHQNNTSELGKPSNGDCSFGRRDVTMERDRRPYKLSAGGAALNVIAFVASLVASVTNHWGSFDFPQRGYMGPWSVCYVVIGSPDSCGNKFLRPSGMAKVAGAGSVACTLLLFVAMIIAPMVTMMHREQQKVCISFRRATLIRMVTTSAAALSGVISVLCYLVEVFLIVTAKVHLSWSFYLQVISFVLGWVIGAGASVEWMWSRKLGGDPTVYGRDQEGTAANTIENKSFRDTKPANNPGRPGGPNRSSIRRAPSGLQGIHKNSNGISMTRLSGQPYMVTANGSNGHVPNGRPNGLVAFDPTRAPLRSSLRKPKPQAPTAEDATDGSANLGIQNLAFTQASPTMKKKVRIHTQSTAV